MSNGQATPDTPPPAPRPTKSAPPPPPRPHFETGAPKHLKPKLPTPKTADRPAAGKPTNQESRPSRSRKDKHRNELRKEKVSTGVTGHVKVKNGVATAPPAPKKVVKKVEKKKNNMNEFVQTDLDKGVADSGQEAPVSTEFM